MSGGFFRGTSADQDTRFSNKQAKLLKTQKFAPELEHLVDITKVKMDVMKPWIARRVTELVGIEDEVLINFIYGLLDAKEVNGKNVQIQLTGFMEKNTGKFMKELWALLLSAQKNASGVPQQFLDAKEEETRKKKEETDRIFNEIQRRKEKETEHKETRKMDDRLDNNSAEGSLRRPERGSGFHPGDENGAGVTNGFRGRKRSSKSPYSSDHSPTPHRAARSRSVSKSLSSPRGRSKERSFSRSISRSPMEKRRSCSPEKVNSPRKRSVTPMRRSARESISPRRRSRSRRRSSSRQRRRSPSPLRRSVHSPVRYRRSPSPRRRSPIYARRRSPSPRHWSRSPARRWLPPRRYRSPSPRRNQSRSPRRRPSPSPRRQRSPIPHRRRQRSASSSRSRSPVHRRPLSPRRHRYESPRCRRSPYPARRRSPTNRRSLSPWVSKSQSPQHSRLSSPRRSPVPARRRSPGPGRRRSLGPGRKRSPAISPSRSQSPASGSSVSPVRHRSVSPVKIRSPRVQQSPQEIPRGNTRTRELARMDHRQPISLSPQRDHASRNSSRRKVPSISPSPERLLSYSGSPKTQAKTRSVSPFESPDRRAENWKNFGDDRSPPDKWRDRKTHHDSPVGTDDRMQNSREDCEKNSIGKRSVRSSGGKNKESPDRSFCHRHNGSDSRKDNKMRSEGYEKEARFLKKSPHKGSLAKETPDLPHAENISKSDERRSSHPKDSGDSLSLLVGSREKIERKSPSVDADSGAEEGGKQSARFVAKKKHRRSRSSKQESASDDSSSDSEIEDRKDAKRRRREEKKLRKEERKRRREERRRRKEEKRASKRKRKSKDSDLSSSDTEKDEKKVYASIRGRGSMKYSSDEDSESQKKRLENELREKALESLRAKKGIGR